MFENIMGEEILLSDVVIITETKSKSYPDYLRISDVVRLTLDTRVEPDKLLCNCAYVYGNNLYVTDARGNLAYIDCEMVYTQNATDIKKKHPEYKRTGGRHAKHDNMDAGHLGVQLGQHPSISMEQDATMNRYGTWRTFERDWIKLLKEGRHVNIKAVFVEDSADSSFSPFWCICETIDEAYVSEYTLLNEADQF